MSFLSKINTTYLRTAHEAQLVSEDNGITDRDRELFSQGWCWELAIELASRGFELAIISETVNNYRGEPEEDTPHCFVIDRKGRALDINGRSSLEKMLVKWCRDHRKGKVLQGKEAKDLIGGILPSDAGRKAAKRIVDDNPQFFRP